jgi:hypothetical protein
MLSAVVPMHLRLLAIPLGLVAFMLGWLTAQWLGPATVGGLAGNLLFGACLVAAAAIPFGVFLLFGGRQRLRPATFTVVEDRFEAPTSAVRAGSAAISWMFVGGVVAAPNRFVQESLGEAAAEALRSPVSLFSAGFFVAISVATLTIERPRLRLDRSGIEIRRLWTRTRVAWDRVAVATARTSAHPDIPDSRLHVDPAFLAHALRRYADAPETRAEIGTAEGLARLKQVPA